MITCKSSYVNREQGQTKFFCLYIVNEHSKTYTFTHTYTHGDINAMKQCWTHINMRIHYEKKERIETKSNEMNKHKRKREKRVQLQITSKTNEIESNRNEANPMLFSSPFCSVGVFLSFFTCLSFLLFSCVAFDQQQKPYG